MIIVLWIFFLLNRKRASAAAVSAPHENPDETESDIETSPQSASRRINSKSLNVLSNGTDSMHSLENDVHVQEFFAKPAEQPLLLDCQRKNLQQCMSYGLYGMVMNYLSERFLRHVTYLPAMRSRSILDWQDQTPEKFLGYVCFFMFSDIILIIAINGIIDIV